MKHHDICQKLRDGKLPCNCARGDGTPKTGVAVARSLALLVAQIEMMTPKQSATWALDARIRWTIKQRLESDEDCAAFVEEARERMRDMA